MRIAENNRALTYEQKTLAKKATAQDQHEHLSSDKNHIRKKLSEAPAYEITSSKYDSYKLKYLEELNKSTGDGISGAMDKYESIYNDITKNTPEGITRDSLLGALDEAFEGSGFLYAHIMATRITALSGSKVQARPLVMGSDKMDKLDTTELKNTLGKTKEIENEIKNMFVNAKNYFQGKGSFSGIPDSVIASDAHKFTINDLNELSKGLMKELTDLSKSGATNEKVSEKVNQSNLSDYTKQLLNDVIQNVKV